jgi:ubiquinone/menaquinone biosynthesis C-methylase UbiE
VDEQASLRRQPELRLIFGLLAPDSCSMAERLRGLGMFTKSAEWYDAIYSWKDYPREAERLHSLIQRHGRRPLGTLLDVACGTGQHLDHLKDRYMVEGLDIDGEMLALARRRHPDVTFHQADMIEFTLGRQFDVVVCLFASIAYAKSLPRLLQALRTMRRHTKLGGLVIAEPFIRSDQFEEGRVTAIYVDRPDLKIARIHVGTTEHGVAVLLFHYLVGTPQGVEHFTERHELGLFSHDEYVATFRAAGLEVVYDEEGLMGRGSYIGVVPETMSSDPS